MKAAMFKSLFIAVMLTATSVHASTQKVSAELDFQLDSSCVQQGESGSIALHTCDMTVASLEQSGQKEITKTYAESSESIESIASPVSEPNTAALMVLGFGVLSMVAGARLKSK